MQQSDIPFAQPAVLSYARADLVPRHRTTRVILMLLRGLHLLAGGGALAYGIFLSRDAESLIGGLVLAAIGALHVAIWSTMSGRWIRGWRVARALLGAAMVLSLGLVIFGVVLVVLYSRVKGWDELFAWFGGALAVAASVPFLINLITTWYLMRPPARVVFGVDPVAPFTARKLFMRMMLGLWTMAMIVAVIAWMA